MNVEKNSCLMLLIVGVKASLRASMAIGLQASKREAPKARYVSTLSLLSLSVCENHELTKSSRMKTNRLTQTL